MEADVWRTARGRVREHLARDEVVCFDATSVGVERRAVLIRLAKQAKKPLIAAWTRVPEAIAWERNVARPRPVPRAAFRRLARALQAPTVEEGFDAVLVIEPDGRVPGSATEPA